MISEPKYGWCNFKIGDFTATPSGYMTAVVPDLLDAFIDYYKKGYGMAALDEEGSYVTLVLNRLGIYLIVERDRTFLLDYGELDKNSLARGLIKDVESDFDNWVDFTEEEGGDQFASVHIYNKICELRELIGRKTL